MSNVFEKLAEKIGVVVQGGTVNIGEINVESDKPVRPRNEQWFLEKVTEEIYGYLVQGLNDHYIELDKELLPQHPKQQWTASIKTSSESAENISGNIRILDLFLRHDIGGKLLIHGHPGSGKTTTLLELGKSLLENYVNKDLNSPMPAKLDLRNWQGEDFLNYLITELSFQRPKLNRKIILSWIKEGKIIFLFDQLDEVKPNLRRKCIDSLNNFLEGEYAPDKFAICCRTEEYRNLEFQLAVNGSLHLKNLTRDQIYKYLNEANNLDLWNCLIQDEDLLELAKTPLFLDIFRIAYKFLGPTDLNKKNSKELLLDAYASRMLNIGRRSTSHKSIKNIEPKVRRRYLVFLSQQLEREYSTDFLIEKIQPSLLIPLGLMKLYLVLCFVLIGIPFAFIVSLLASQFGYSFAFFTFIVTLPLLPFVIFWEDSSVNDLAFSSFLISDIQLSEKIVWSWTSAKLYALIVWHEGLSKYKSFLVPSSSISIAGAAMVLFYGFSGGGQPERIILMGASVALFLLFAMSLGFLFITIFSTLAMGFYGGLVGLEDDKKAFSNQGIFRTLRSIVTKSKIASLVGCVFGLLFSLLFTPPQSLILMIISGILLSLIFACLFFIVLGPILSAREIWSCTKHLLVRIILFRHHYIPWDYANFLDDCVGRRLLQRVGGRYRFVHKLLQEHFAAMLLDTPEINNR